MMEDDHNLTSDAKDAPPQGRKGTDEPWKVTPQKTQDPTERKPTNPTGKKSSDSAR